MQQSVSTISTCYISVHDMYINAKLLQVQAWVLIKYFGGTVAVQAVPHRFAKRSKGRKTESETQLRGNILFFFCFGGRDMYVGFPTQPCTASGIISELSTRGAPMLAPISCEASGGAAGSIAVAHQYSSLREASRPNFFLP